MSRTKKPEGMPAAVQEQMKAVIAIYENACKGIVASADIPMSAIVAIPLNAPKPSTKPLTSGDQTSEDFRGVGVPKNIEYRKKPINPRQEFLFDRLYVTKTGKPSFIFKPCDAREWLHAEFDMDNIDKIFPEFSYEVAKLFNASIPSLRILADASSGDIYGVIMRHVVKTEERKKKEEAEELMLQMEQHPDWGAF